MSRYPCYTWGMEKIVMVSTEGYDIETVLNEVEDKEELIILIHGMASDRDEVGQMFKRLADSLSETGIASVRYDQPGCGTSPLSSKEASLSKDRKDALAIYDHYKSLGYRRIGILGFSLGARIMAGLLDKRQFDYAVSWSGAIADGLGPFKDYYEKFYETAVRDGFVDIGLTWRDPFYLSKEMFDEMAEDKALDVIRGYAGPILVVVGTEDTVVTPEHGKDILAAAPNMDSELYTLKTDHTFGALEGKDYSEEVIGLTVGYIAMVISEV